MASPNPTTDACAVCDEAIVYRQEGSRNWRWIHKHPPTDQLHTAVSASFCNEQLRPRGRYESFSARHLCRKPIKADGLCGVHLGAKKRGEKKQQEKKQERAEERALEESAEAVVERAEKAGFSASKHYDSVRYRYDGRVVVEREDLVKLLDAWQDRP